MSKKWMDGINGEAMDKFMADLRSGNFGQTKYTLADRRGFCCLGVATEGAADACKLEKLSRSGPDFYYQDEAGRKFGSHLPMVVAKYLGLPPNSISQDGGDTSTNVWLKASDEEIELGFASYRVDGEQRIAASSLNDTLKKSFAEIADRFEATFKVEEENK